MIIQRCFFIFLLALVFTTSYAQHDTDNKEKVTIKRQHKQIDAMYDSVYQWRIKQSKLDDIYIPLDLYDCFRQLDKLMEDEVKERFIAFSDEEVDARTHGSLGLWIDHKWSLTNGSRLSAYFRKMGIPHPQYMVGMIIQTYHRHLNKRDLGVKELVKKYQDMWAVKQKEEAKIMLEKSATPKN